MDRRVAAACLKGQTRNVIRDRVALLAAGLAAVGPLRAARGLNFANGFPSSGGFGHVGVPEDFIHWKRSFHAGFALR